MYQASDPKQLLHVVAFHFIWQDCSHVKRIFQKDWVFSHAQNRYNSFSVSMWQNVHFPLSTRPSFSKKLFVDISWCKNLKLKTISFEFFVHWNNELVSRFPVHGLAWREVDFVEPFLMTYTRPLNLLETNFLCTSLDGLYFLKKWRGSFRS